MPVSTAQCIFATSPIFCALFAHLYLHEKVTKFDVIPIFTSFIGILIINNPHQDQDALVDPTKLTYSARDKLIGTLFALSGACGGAMANITKRLMKTGIHYSISPFWFACGCTFWSPMAHISYTTRRETQSEYIGHKYDLFAFVLIFLCSITTFFGQVLQSKAFQMNKANRVATLAYLQIVVMFMWDIIFFNSHLRPTDVIGSIMIVGVIFIITLARAFEII